MVGLEAECVEAVKLKRWMQIFRPYAAALLAWNKVRLKRRISLQSLALLQVMLKAQLVGAGLSLVAKVERGDGQV